MTGRWSQKDRRIRSVEAMKALASVSDRTLGHLVTGRWWVAFGLLMWQRTKESPCDWTEFGRA